MINADDISRIYSMLNENNFKYVNILLDNMRTKDKEAIPTMLLTKEQFEFVENY